MPRRAAHGREVTHDPRDGLPPDELRRCFEREMHILHQRVRFEQRVLILRAAHHRAVIPRACDDIAIELYPPHEAADELVFSDFG